ncbi:MAG TPA: cytochrome c oxidase subunit II [Candidatus Limnocylindria bacterium]|nr:cytochrome c oxidase subunit II [Candidatus Limnocylindria bacterium]
MPSLVRRMRLALPLALVALPLQSGLALADDPWVSAPAGAVAREVQPTYWIMFAFAVLVLAIVDGGLIYAAIRYRERPGHVARQFHGHNMLELTWTVIPTLMVIGFSVISFQRLQFINDTRGADVDMAIGAHGRQWSFTFQYPQEPRFRLADGTYLSVGEELHVPVGAKVRIELSAEDVIHSFWVPQIGGKKDAVPGRKTELWIQADVPGTFKGQCVEFCGDGHADMLITLVAHPANEYDAWAKQAVENANLLNDPATKQGAELFKQRACFGCHFIRGVGGGRVGPELTTLARKDNIAGVLRPVNVENLVRWIDDPPAAKPGTQMPKLGLPPEEVQAIAQFLATATK